jgi:hypothetical protein
MSGDEMIAWPEKAEDRPAKAGANAGLAALRARRNEPPFRNPRRRKMTKLRNIVGIALVAMSMLTGLAVTSGHAQELIMHSYHCESSPDGEAFCWFD